MSDNKSIIFPTIVQIGKKKTQKNIEVKMEVVSEDGTVLPVRKCAYPLFHSWQ